MKYALVNDERLEAQKGLSGKCPCCEMPTIPKCGKVKIPHWAHKGKLMCDPWWEETEWHRAWKGQFHKEWQEVIHEDENGERHIADVKTQQGFVVEFQHSPIELSEQQAREDFYKNILWIVDGTRRLKDKDKFWKYSEPVNGFLDLRKLRSCFDKCSLLRDWSSCKAAVLFDFGESVLWVLLPTTLLPGMKDRYVFTLQRNLVISLLRAAPPEINFDTYLKELACVVAEYEKSLRKGRRMKIFDFLCF